VRTQTTDFETGRARLEADEASALLVIPPGFGEAVLRDRYVELDLLTNPAQRILPSIVTEMLGILTDGTFYLHRILGEEIRLVADAAFDTDGAPREAFVADVAVQVDRMVEKLRRWLFPPAIRFEVVHDEQAEPRTPIAILFLPGIMMMSLLFTAQGLADDIWRERELGTLRRAACMPGGGAVLLLGKLAAGALVILGVSIVVLAAGTALLDLEWSRLPLAVAWSTLAGIAFLAILTWLQMLAGSRRAASTVSNSLILPLLMLGGSFFPLETMPGWLAAVGSWTPNGQALEVLKAIILGRSTEGSLGLALVVLLLVSAIFTQLGIVRLRRRFAAS
jgi:ABC-type Na+ efflux pump permease subunit